MLPRQPHNERIFEQDHDLHRTAIVRQRKQHHVELATVQRLDEAVRQILDEIQLEAAITRGSRKGPMVGMIPSRRMPERGSREARVTCTSSSAALTILRARSAVSIPTGVRTTRRLLRSTSVASSTPSSSLMLALS